MASICITCSVSASDADACTPAAKRVRKKRFNSIRSEVFLKNFRSAGPELQISIRDSSPRPVHRLPVPQPPSRLALPAAQPVPFDRNLVTLVGEQVAPPLAR